MGCRCNPVGYRVGVNKDWSNRYLNKSGKEFGKAIAQDELIRKYLYKEFNDAIIESVGIERLTNKNSFDKESNKDQEEVIVYMSVGQPALITEEAKQQATKYIEKLVRRIKWKTCIKECEPVNKYKVTLVVSQYKNTNWSARALARRIADQIANRVPFRIAQLNAIKDAMNNKVLGIKTHCSGRLGGVEMARVDNQSKGFIPISTIRCDLDYAYETSKTVMGIIGVKVWINRGEILKKAGKGVELSKIQNTPVELVSSNRKPKNESK